MYKEINSQTFNKKKNENPSEQVESRPIFEENQS